MVLMPTPPTFREGKELTTSFTGTLSERYGAPIERIPSPQRLLDWLGLHGLDVDACSPAQLVEAHRLREAIHLLATAAARGEPQPAAAAELVNRRAAHGSPWVVLTLDGQQRWRLHPEHPLDDALSVIARDAIGVISGQRGGRLALCAAPTCRAVFVDTSRGRSRRWCDMNTCGNREKKARFHGNPTSD